MFHKIVVALDYAEPSSPVFDEALSLAKMMGAQLRLLNVLSFEDSVGYQLPAYPGGFYAALTEPQLNLYREEWAEFKNRSLRQLEADIETAKAAGVSAELCQLYGNPGKRICEFAQNWSADLILMGRRGRTGISELLLGSASNYVLHHACCAVLVLNTALQPREATNRAASLRTTTAPS
ncbi:universal stress protein [Altericista sp. CCNU0014]|uniref:universal stress protein n=1 Tax=Altericista sp. CCNU0014 TaxID=3082949 RepID=UPI00384BFAA1